MAATEEAEMVPHGDAPVVTTISTVAIQAGEARIVLAVLNVSLVNLYFTILQSFSFMDVYW